MRAVCSVLKNANQNEQQPLFHCHIPLPSSGTNKFCMNRYDEEWTSAIIVCVLWRKKIEIDSRSHRALIRASTDLSLLICGSTEYRFGLWEAAWWCWTKNTLSLTVSNSSINCFWHDCLLKSSAIGEREREALQNWNFFPIKSVRSFVNIAIELSSSIYVEAEAMRKKMRAFYH